MSSMYVLQGIIPNATVHLNTSWNESRDVMTDNYGLFDMNFEVPSGVTGEQWIDATFTGDLTFPLAYKKVTFMVVG